MYKKWAYYISIITTIAFLSYGFKPFQLENHDWFSTKGEDKLSYSYPSLSTSDYNNLDVPFTGKFFVAYKEAIAFRESQGQYRLVNTFGYMGKYQFGKSALRAIGIKDFNNFLRNPALQEKAFEALCAKNKYELRDEIAKYEGKTVAGIKVTESGILAAAHLGGAGSVKRFFKSNGTRYLRDGYGTSIRSYMRTFGGYETTGIVADSNAIVKM
ncbi:MAG: peptidoglycan-binding protein LysM [Flavobacterium sp.]|uniref:peptidoglycan-binding protein LysM n=1 Tax=Flavobacterium sp. TaxID=239 RepID=UPI00122B2E74|nr:peptidoglycan-binding protein LysM [Flavobacterium sp.]RZJ64162.1 MAG: peptidoglycan-binding protein LysM [Flavobacterium sp.]